MADNVTPEAVVSGAAFSFATDDITTVHYPISKLAYGALDSATLVSTSNGFPVQQQGTWNIGTVTTVTAVTSITNVVHVDDNAGSLTVDNAGTFAVQATLAAGATTIAKAEDVASANADVGVPAMAVQKATPANTAGTDGDYEFLQMSAGRLWVDASGVTLTVGSHAVTNAGTFVVQENGAALTSLQLIDDTVVADDAAFTPATTKVIMAGFTFDDVAPDSVNEGDAGAARMSANRNIYTTLRDAAGNERGANVNASNQLSVSVDNTVTVGSHAVTNAGTFAVQVDGAALTSLQLIDDVVFAEDAAHTTGDKGIMALTVRQDTAAATAGTTGDYQPAVTNARGATWVAIEDGAGGQITSFGGGTQYTEDAAAAANPVGTTPIFVRQDTPASEVSANGDNIAGRATAYGAQFVQLVNSSGGFIDSFSGAGTQYTEDVAAAVDPIGTVLNLVRQDALSTTTVSADGDNIAARGSSTGAQYVVLTDDTTKIVSGNGTAATALRVTVASDSTGVIGATQSGTWNIGTVTTVTGVTTVSTVTALNGSNLAHDGATGGAASVKPHLIGGFASAAAPTDVTADADAVNAWFLRNGSQVIQPAFAGVLATTGNGVSGTGVQRVTIASDSTGLINVNPGTAANWGVYVEDAAETAGGNLSMAGAVRRDTLASSSGTSGDNSTINTNNVGALWVAGAASTNGGWSVATGSIAATKTDIGTANTAGHVAGWYFYNPNASVAYVQFFNTQASGVTLGTTAPVYSLGIPASSAANIAPGMVGIAHSTAISIAVTTTRAGSTGPGSTVDYNIWYKQ